MVLDTENPRNFLEASCCNVLVVNGAGGLDFDIFVDILLTVKSQEFRMCSKVSASCLLYLFEPPILAVNGVSSCGFSLFKTTEIFQ